MSRKKKPGAYSIDDREMLETLFDIGERDHVVDLVKGAHDPTPVENRESLKYGIEKYLLPSIKLFIEKLYEQGRGERASEWDAAQGLLRNAETVAKLLCASQMSAEQSAECASWIDDAWTRFIADASAYRMGELAREIEKQRSRNVKLNKDRQRVADEILLTDFRKWQLFAKSQIVNFNAKECVRRYKIHRRPLGDRDTRRINRLLRENKIPSVPK